jgi:Ca-activated chloride channel family protein
MLSGKVITSALALVLLASIVLGGSGSLTLAQNPSAQKTHQAETWPPQIIESQQQPAPSPTPKLKPKDEEAPGQSEEVIRVETNLTNIFFTAEDKHKRFISSLKQEDIRVYEDGQPQQIFTFQTNTDLPLSLAILIDTSRSEERTLPEEKSAAREFLESSLRPNRDEAAVVSFTGEVTLEQGFTGSLERLRRAIDKVEFVPPSGYIGGGIVVPTTPPISGTNQIMAAATAIWDAVWATSNELLSESAEHTRRAIILLTDGDDTISQMKMHEAIERAQKAEALVYAIGIGDRYNFNVNESALRKITDQTGGRAYFPRNERELREAFAQIQHDLREQYLVAYSPTNKARDGSYRRIQVEIVNPELKKETLKLNYRQGYFAKAPDSGTSAPARKRP